MRFVSLFAVAAMAAAPSFSSAAVMVAHFEGSVGGIHSTGSTRLGHPPLYVFSGPFVAEITYDTEAGSALAAPLGAERRNAASIKGGWIEFEDVHVDIPSAEYGEVTARANGFSILAQHYVASPTQLDTLSLSATFAGTGDLEAPVGSLSATGLGELQLASSFSGAFTLDLFGNCSYECGGMSLLVSKFSLSQYVAPGPGPGPTPPSPAPEPSAWAVMILGFGAAGTALRRRRAAFG